jgi:hypothetical protein
MSTNVSRFRRWRTALALGIILAFALSLAQPTRAESATATVYGVDDIERLSIDQRLLLISLQGLVNRGGPILWLRSGPGQSPGLPAWEQTLPELRGMVHISYREALQRFAVAPYVVGAVVVDPAIEETYNVATNLAAQQQLAIITPTTLGEVALPIREDLRGRYADTRAARTANLALFAGANHEMALKVLPWSDSNYLYNAPERGRDLAIQRRYFTFAKASTDADLLDFYRGPLDDVRTLYGTAEDENLDVYRASQAGKVWLGMGLQLQYNLSVFDGLRGDPGFVYRQPPVTFAPISHTAAKRTVRIAFVMTEGDNPFFMINQMKLAWADPNHGQVPIGWTIAPRMLDLAPALLQSYYDTATPNDYFIAGVSGVAYFHVNAMDFGRYPQLLNEETPQTLRRLDIRIIRNFGDWLGAQMTFYDRLRMTAAAYPDLLGWIEGHGIPSPLDPTASRYERTTATQLDGKYLDVPFSAWCNGNADVPRTVEEIRTFIGNHQERSLMILVGMDLKDSSPTTVRAIMDQLGTGYEYVRPDVLYRSRPATLANVATPQVNRDSALFTWTTDELTTGQLVIEGPQGGRTVSEPETPVGNHRLTVGQLQPGVAYRYHIIVHDADGNTTRSEDAMFTTPVEAAPVVGTFPWFAGAAVLCLALLILSMFWFTGHAQGYSEELS